MATEDLSGLGGAGSGGISISEASGGVTLPEVVAATKVYYRLISLTELTNKEIILPEIPSNPSLVQVDIIGGMNAKVGEDFNISGNAINWNGLTMDGIIAQGDTLRIAYITS